MTLFNVNKETGVAKVYEDGKHTGNIIPMKLEDLIKDNETEHKSEKNQTRKQNDED